MDADRDDVAALMAEIEARVAEKRAAGLYSVDALAADRPTQREPYMADDLVEVSKLAEIQPNLGLTASTKPAVGKAVGKVKEGMVRATSQPLLDLADRTTAFNVALLAYVSELAQEVAALRARVAQIDGIGSDY